MTAWTKRYNTDLHFDLMQIWGGWTTEGREKLDAVAAMALNGALVRDNAPFSTAYFGRDWTMRESRTASFSISDDIS
jgi:hypothetical protein